MQQSIRHRGCANIKTGFIRSNHRESEMRRCWLSYSLALLLLLAVAIAPSWTGAEGFILGSGAPVPVVPVEIRDRHSEELDEQLADKIKFVVLAREPEIATFVSVPIRARFGLVEKSSSCSLSTFLVRLVREWCMCAVTALFLILDQGMRSSRA